jgi:hypothetical protein
LVWLGYQFRPDEVLVPWYIHNSENFPLGAWQVLFITALVIGFHRKQLTDWIARRPRAQLAIVGAALGACLVATWLFQVVGDANPEVFAKVPLRPARLIGFAGAAVLAYTVATLAWEPLRRGLGWLLLPLGQHALYCYVVHFFLIVLLMNVLPSDMSIGGRLSSVAVGTMLQLGLIITVWGLVRRKILFSVVPN